MDELRINIRQALRSFVKNPAFTAVVVLTLALGIGANTAIFSLMDQVLLRLLPVKDPDRLVILQGPGPFSGRASSHSNTLQVLSHPMFEHLRDQSTVFSGVLAEFTASIHLGEGGQTDDVHGDLVSGTYFETLGAVCSTATTTACPAVIPSSSSVTASGRVASRRTAASSGARSA